MADGIKKAGGISFGVSMNTSKLARDVKTARGLMGGFVSGTTRLLGSFQAQLTGIVGVGGLATLVSRSLSAIDALHDTAKNLGITTRALSGLGHAADLSGSSQASLERGLAKMVKTTRDAALGVEVAARAYGKLGLNAAELHRLSPDKQFMLIADAVSNLKTTQEQLTVTQDIFGRGAANLVETLRLGSKGLGDMRAEAESLGIAVNDIDAARVAKAADEWERMKKSFSGLSNELTITLVPVITLMANELERAARAAGGMSGGENGWLGKNIKDLKDIWQMAGRIGAGAGSAILRPVSDIISGMDRWRNAGVPGTGTKTGFAQSADWFIQDLQRNLSIHAYGQKAANSTSPAMRSGGFGFGSQRNALKNLLGTPKQIWEGLSSPIAQAQRMAGLAELKRAGSTWKDSGSFFGGIADQIKNSAMGRNATQIFGGLRDGLVPQMMRQLLGANLSNGMAGRGAFNGTSAKHTVGSFDAVESGSLAAYQQRIRGAQQFNKVQDKQLAAQERMAKTLDSIDGKTVEWGPV